MKRSFSDDALKDYYSFQKRDNQKLKKINRLIEDIEINGALKGIGHPEVLKHDFTGYYSRRIDKKDRLIYKIINDETIFVLQCNQHYIDK